MKKQQQNGIIEWNGTAPSKNGRQKALLDQRDFLEMEKGHRVCKVLVLKKFDTGYLRIWLNTQTQQIALSKWTNSMDSGSIPGPSSFMPNGLTTLAIGSRTSSLSSLSLNALGPQSKTHTLDLRLIREVAILGKLLTCPGSTMQIAEKWRRDGALQRLDPNLVLCIAWGAAFLPITWLILFDSKETCNLWAQGLNQICAELVSAPHALVVERWLRKQFCSLLPHSTDTGCLTIKQMKPFVQQRLQYKVTSKQLQEITDSELSFEGFVFAHNRLLDFHSLFTSMFAEYADPKCPQRIRFQQFYDFQRTFQKTGKSPEMASDFLRYYLRDVDPDRDLAEPWLSTAEFIDFLYSPENSLFDPINKEIVHDMTKPLTHYWISSSHNTYLTGDQLKSESSLDAYSRALLMGCRCIELDCWDGAQRRGPGGEIQIDIVIYHGYTMTSKLALRDVLYTIKQYAFQRSEYPLILSIEDNCSVPAQRQMAVDIQEVLGDLLLTAPVSRDEWQLPSPAALRRKIILKHKKLQNDRQEADAVSLLEDELEQDILSRRCIKKGILWLRGGPSSAGNGSEWAKHIFVLFNDRLCFLIQPIDQYQGDGNGNNSLNGNGQKPLAGRENSLSSQGDENLAIEEESNNAQISENPDACAEAHITEEWFHGKVDREVAKTRLLESAKILKLNGNSSSNGLFLVRESSTFIGDFTLSFLHNGSVHHCRIKTSISAGGERKYHLLDTIRRDTLYELISYYTRHSLDTPNFKTLLQIPCPQPQLQRGQPWYSELADTQKAEELLNAVNADGAFLIRHSTSDRTVFVLSLRVDGKCWHYRLKREGRIFVVNQHMFENLCQLVDYYSQNQFVRGICLEFPVNEITVGNYATVNNIPESGGEFVNGFYMELKDLDTIVSPAGTGTGSELNYGTIELVGTKFEKFNSDRANSFKISLAQSHWNVQEYLVAANCPEEMEEWLNACQHQAQQANDKMHQLRTRERQLGIASELSSLVIYCQAVPFNPDFELQDNRFSFYEMCSFSESKHDKLVERGLIRFNQRQLSRVYPQASRLTSANFNPLPMWNNGCHMVALNFQTGDKAMQLNAGKFLANGRCGFVLKPQYLMDETFQQKSPAVDQKYKKCRACRRYLQKLSIAMASTSSQLPPENIGGQRRQSILEEESKETNKKEHKMRPPKLSLTTNSNSSGDFADDELLKSTARRNSSFPIEEEADGGDDDKCSCKMDDVQSNGDSDQPSHSANLQNPSSSSFASNCPISLHLLVIAGRHLSRRGCYDKGGICSPYVEIELLGFPQDSQSQKTNTITSNGLNPIWQESFLFNIQYPEMCLLRFYVEDGDFVGPKTDPFIGQAVFPVDCIRPGFRSIPLLNQFSEPLELSALLVHVEIRHWDQSKMALNSNATVQNQFNSLIPGGGSSTTSLHFGSGSTLSALLTSTTTANQQQQNQITTASISNVHQLLQSGRSIYSGAQPSNSTTMANENNSRLNRNRNTSTQQLISSNAGPLAGGLPSSYGQQMGSESRTSRSTSMESGETTTTNNSTAQMLPLTKRGMGSNTLRKIFRLRRDN